MADIRFDDLDRYDAPAGGDQVAVQRVGEVGRMDITRLLPVFFMIGNEIGVLGGDFAHPKITNSTDITFTFQDNNEAQASLRILLDYERALGTNAQNAGIITSATPVAENPKAVKVTLLTPISAAAGTNGNSDIQLFEVQHNHVESFTFPQARQDQSYENGHLLIPIPPKNNYEGVFNAVRGSSSSPFSGIKNTKYIYNGSRILQTNSAHEYIRLPDDAEPGDVIQIILVGEFSNNDFDLTVSRAASSSVKINGQNVASLTTEPVGWGGYVIELTDNDDIGWLVYSFIGRQ